MLRCAVVCLALAALCAHSAPVEGNSVQLENFGNDVSAWFDKLVNKLVGNMVEHEGEVRNATKNVVGQLAEWGFNVPKNVDKELDEFFTKAKAELNNKTRVY